MYKIFVYVIYYDVNICFSRVRLSNKGNNVRIYFILDME